MMAENLAALIEQRYGLSPTAGHDHPADGALGRILARRSHRRYLDKPVSSELMELLFATAFSASSKSDLQQSSVIWVKAPDKRRAIADLIPDMPWVGAAPIFLLWLGDNRRIRRVCELRDKPFGNDHLDSFLNAATDTALTMQTFILAAESVGLGCCPISAVRNVAAEVAAIAHLPAHVFPYAGLCVGWPAQEGHVSLRLPASVTVHVDRYDDSMLPEELDAYDRRRDARYAIPREKQRGLTQFGEAAFYGWSEDKARQVAAPERDDYGAFVRRQGMKLD